MSLILKTQYRLDTAANWATENPVLLNGEVGKETDTGKKKEGDGITPWNSLPYLIQEAPINGEPHFRQDGAWVPAVTSAFPAPHLEELIPDSHLPSTTGNFILKGSYFIEEMCLAANLNNTNGILIEGQTINYATFISDNQINVNITTGAAEGEFDVTLNNGIQRTFNNVLLIVLGTVFEPTSADWVSVSASAPDLSEKGSVELTVWDDLQTAKWNKALDHTKDYSLRFNFQRSSLNNFPTNWRENMFEVITSTGVVLFGAQFQLESTTLENMYVQTNLDGLGQYKYQGTPNTDYESRVSYLESFKPKFDFVGGVMRFYINGVLKGTYSNVINEDLFIRIKVRRNNIINIKYIELAT